MNDDQTTPVLEKVPVITIDGPSGTGKGTLAHLLAEKLGWHILDSGALYRIVGVGSLEAGLSHEDPDGVADYARNLDVVFPSGSPGSILLSGREVSDWVRLESSGEKASVVAAMPQVRKALLDLQLGFRKQPGLVADGRDMGTVVFPDAPLKIFLTADAMERAKRRHKQLINKGVAVNLPALFEDIKARDERDTNRVHSPLKPADDAVIIDTSDMVIDQVLETVSDHVHRVFQIST